MTQCSASGDCFKASLQFKIDKATGKVSQNATKAQWQAKESSSPEPTRKGKATDLGVNFDADS
jgi:hypothetical protein